MANPAVFLSHLSYIPCSCRDCLLHLAHCLPSCHHLLLFGSTVSRGDSSDYRLALYHSPSASSASNFCTFWSTIGSIPVVRENNWRPPRHQKTQLTASLSWSNGISRPLPHVWVQSTAVPLRWCDPLRCLTLSRLKRGISHLCLALSEVWCRGVVVFVAESKWGVPESLNRKEAPNFCRENLQEKYCSISEECFELSSPTSSFQ